MRATALIIAGAIACGTVLDAEAQPLPTATAVLIDTSGREVGVVRLEETPVKGVMLRIEVSGLTPGVHAIHIHERGRCDPPNFESAGGHFEYRGHDHGFRAPNGSHAGDLTNLYVPGDGRIEAERLARDVTLAEGLLGSLFDADGSAIVIHAGADDYLSQPSGNAGAPVVCGVIRR